MKWIRANMWTAVYGLRIRRTLDKQGVFLAVHELFSEVDFEDGTVPSRQEMRRRLAAKFEGVPESDACHHLRQNVLGYF